MWKLEAGLNKVEESPVDTLLKLLRIAIGTEKDYIIPKDVDWHKVINLSYQQNVAAIAVDGLQKIYNSNVGISLSLDEPELEDLKYEWFGCVLKTEAKFSAQLSAVSRLAEVFKIGNLPFMVLKGISLARYYPNPTHRECGDVDIYLGNNYERSNYLLKENGIEYDEYYYRHSASYINGIMIENHRILCDTRGPIKSKYFEQLLVSKASKSFIGHEEMVFPSADFNALFLSWHAASHFMFEKITLRQILDWMLFLTKDGMHVNPADFRYNRNEYKYNFGIFSSILTAIGLRWFGFDRSEIPDMFLEGIESVDDKLVNRVANYILNASPKERDDNVWKFRRNIVRRAWADRWKFQQLYGIGFAKLMLYKMAGILQGDKSMGE